MMGFYRTYGSVFRENGMLYRSKAIYVVFHFWIGVFSLLFLAAIGLKQWTTELLLMFITIAAVFIIPGLYARGRYPEEYEILILLGWFPVGALALAGWYLTSWSVWYIMFIIGLFLLNTVLVYKGTRTVKVGEIVTIKGKKYRVIKEILGEWYLEEV